MHGLVGFALLIAPHSLRLFRQQEVALDDSRDFAGDDLPDHHYGENPSLLL